MTDKKRDGALPKVSKIQDLPPKKKAADKVKGGAKAVERDTAGVPDIILL
jgi:hypothetical protein